MLESVETLLEEGFQPRRTVILSFGYNEELIADERAAAPMLAAALKARGVELESVLDEGGAILPLNVRGVLDRKLIGVGVAEKGYCDFEISVEAKGGHSSAPPKHSAVGELAKAVVALEKHQFRARITPEVRQIVDTVSRNMTYPARLVSCRLPMLLPLAKPALTQIPTVASMLRTTTAVTMTQGSPRANVLPQKASATVNFRLMPGCTIEDV